MLERRCDVYSILTFSCSQLKAIRPIGVLQIMSTSQIPVEVKFEHLNHVAPNYHTEERLQGGVP
jgi:hypothetical protein